MSSTPSVPKGTARRTRQEQLAAYFMTTQTYTSTQSIYQRFYQDAPTQDAARRAFARDRKSLETLGFSFEMMPKKDDPSMYYVRAAEEKSFFTYSLTPLQAKFLSTLCRPLLHEESFLWAEDLRYALFKLAGASQEILLALKQSDVMQMNTPNSSTSQGSHTLLATQLAHLTSKEILAQICSAQENNKLVQADYCTADGTINCYTFLPVGVFSRYAQTYVVAQKYSSDVISTYKSAAKLPQDTPFDVRVFRLDRFRKLTETHTYATKDTSIHVEDFRVLPTQIGVESIPAQLFIPKQTKIELMRTAPHTIHEECFTENTNSLKDTHPYVWTTTFHNLDTGILWCIEEHIIPKEPNTIVDAWECALAQIKKTLLARLAETTTSNTSCVAYPKDEKTPSHQIPQPLFAKNSSKGRPSSTTTTRRVITLLSLLKHQGDTISAQEIETMFSCSAQEAQNYLWELLLLSDISHDFYVPLSLTDDDLLRNENEHDTEHIAAVSLQTLSGARHNVYGKTLQLTLAEVRALTHALKLIGISDVQDMANIFSSHKSPAQETKNARTTNNHKASTSALSHTLATIARAITAHQCIQFLYNSRNTQTSTPRVVLPASTFYHNQRWYMSAFDTGAHMWKTYIAANMYDVKIRAEKVGRDVIDTPSPTAPNEMSMSVYDTRVLSDLWWPQETSATKTGDEITLCVRGFDPAWLDRRLIAYAYALNPHDIKVTQRLIRAVDEMYKKHAHVKGI